MKQNYVFFILIILCIQFGFSQNFTENTIGLIPYGFARGLEVEDLNNDNHLDVLILDTNGTPEIIYWLGDGNGNFGPGTSIDNNLTNNSGPADDIALMDVNNDNFLDIVVAISISHQHKIVWYPNNQDGTFGTRVVLDDGGWRSNHIVLFDADNNGYDDIIISDRNSSTYNNSIYYLPNQGNGTFGAKVTVTNTAEVLGLSSGKFNNDTLEDLVYTEPSTGSVNILINNGDGTFGNVNSISINGPYYVTVGNLNNDSNDDILISKFNLSETLSAYYGNGDGTFGSQSIISDQEVNAIINSTITDIDNDGDNDIFSATQVQSGFTWFENTGNGIFSSANIIDTQSSDASYDIKTGDINEDGKLDIILSTDDGVFWFQNNLTLSTNTYELEETIQVYPNPTTNILHINSNTLNLNKIEVFDLKGRLVLSKNRQLSNIDLSSLFSGVYILKIYSERGIYEHKIIKK